MPHNTPPPRSHLTEFAALKSLKGTRISPAVVVAFVKGRRFMREIIFEVTEDEVDGGYVASALGYGIHTQGDTLDELRGMVKDAVSCYFDNEAASPSSFACISFATKS
jgi:predicted RNase H-like HicB family nuclease